jgi:hypothetical protein
VQFYDLYIIYKRDLGATQNLWQAVCGSASHVGGEDLGLLEIKYVFIPFICVLQDAFTSLKYTLSDVRLVSE